MTIFHSDLFFDQWTSNVQHNWAEFQAMWFHRACSERDLIVCDEYSPIHHHSSCEAVPPPSLSSLIFLTGEMMVDIRWAFSDSTSTTWNIWWFSSMGVSANHPLLVEILRSKPILGYPHDYGKPHLGLLPRPTSFRRHRSELSCLLTIQFSIYLLTCYVNGRSCGYSMICPKLHQENTPPASPNLRGCNAKKGPCSLMIAQKTWCKFPVRNVLFTYLSSYIPMATLTYHTTNHFLMVKLSFYGWVHNIITRVCLGQPTCWVQSTSTRPCSYNSWPQIAMGTIRTMVYDGCLCFNHPKVGFYPWITRIVEMPFPYIVDTDVYVYKYIYI